jgi:hypothetical protein
MKANRIVAINVGLLSIAILLAVGSWSAAEGGRGASAPQTAVGSVKRVVRGVIEFPDQMHNIQPFNRADEAKLIQSVQLSAAVNPEKCVVLLSDPVRVHRGAGASDELDRWATAAVIDLSAERLTVRFDRSGGHRAAPGLPVDNARRGTHWIVSYQIVEHP